MPNPAITLVFTDIVGSSAAKRAATLGADVSERDRAYLAGIQAEHLRLVRGTLEKHHGREIMTMGDSFFLTFDDPVNALRCCAAIQQRLLDQPIDTLQGPLRLRIGIHVGTPEFFENSWHGTDVDIAARTQAAASPRQILITNAARDAMGDPLGIQFHSLGLFPLKGVGEMELWDADYDQHGVRAPALPSTKQRRHTRMLGLAAAAILLGSAIGVGIWHFMPEKRADASGESGTGPNSIIVASFENKTGDAVFDGTLTEAFFIQLQQSPILTIVSPEHLRDSMKYLGKSPNDPLTAEVARQIGEREGVQACITGSIAKIGNSYLLQVQATNPVTGDSIASQEAQSADKDHVLDALGKMADAMRIRLGESLESAQKLNTPLAEATTPSLEALRAFTLGNAAHDAGKEVPEAVGYYHQAVGADPHFAMAWAKLGVAYRDSGRGEEADTYIKRAFELSKNVSERERLYIQAEYYSEVTNDVQRAIDILQLACQTYPLDTNNYVNLADAQLSLGLVDPAMDNLRKSFKIPPPNAGARALYFSMLIQTDKFTEARAFGAETRRLGFDDFLNDAVSYSLDFLTDDNQGMSRDVASYSGKSSEFGMTGNVALAREFAGQYRQADVVWRRAADQAALQHAKDAEASSLLFRLSGRAIADLPVNAAQDLEDALKIDSGDGTLASVASNACFCNEPAIALPILADLGRRHPDSTTIQQVLIPEGQAMLALAAHQPQAALHALQDGIAASIDPFAPFLKGLAHLQLHDGRDAVQDFLQVTRYRGAVLLRGSQNYAQSQLGLARAYVMCGDKASARKAYEGLFQTWKNADPDLPQLLAAKRENEALN